MEDNHYLKKKSPVVLLVCEEVALIRAIADNLQGSGFYIAVVISRPKILGNLFDKDSGFAILKSVEEFREKINRLDYLVYIVGEKKGSFYKDISKAEREIKFEVTVYKSLLREYGPKPLLALYGVRNAVGLNVYEEKIRDYFKNSLKKHRLVLYGDLVDLIGPSSSAGNLGRVLKRLIEKGKVMMNRDQLFYPTTSEDLAIHLVKLLFSLKAYGRITAIYGYPVEAKELGKVLGAAEDSIVLSEDTPLLKFIRFDDSLVIKRQSKRNLKMFYSRLKDQYFFSGKAEGLRKAKGIFWHFRKEKLKKYFPGKSKVFFISLLMVFVTPAVLLFTSLVLLLSSMILLSGGFLSGAESTTRSSLFLTQKSYNYSLSASNIPLVGIYFKGFLEPSSLMVSESEAAIAGLKIISSLNRLLESVVGDYEFDTEGFSRQLVFQLDELYQRLGFLEGELSQDSITTEIVGLPFKKFDLSYVREKVRIIKSITEQLPLIMGDESTTRYVVLFQNSHLVRPTGGRIESMALVNFSSGKISEILIEDISYADQKLLGKVDPPEVLKEYFGQNNWYLRDSNWDPDLPSTTETVGLFLDKEFDTSIDGVIMVDDSFLVDVLTYLGANKESETENRLDYTAGQDDYPNTQNPYPLTDLISQLKGRGLVNSERRRVKILSAIYNGLENKSLQINFKDDELNGVLTDTVWGGAFTRKTCQETCFQDFVSLIEAAYEGDSKEVTREAQLSVFFEEKVIKRKLTVYLENKGENTYKAYFRVFANPESGFAPLALAKLNEGRVVEPEVRAAGEYKEAGVFLEVESKESLAATFVWETEFPITFEEKGEYRLYWRKQAGVESYDAEVFVYVPKNLLFFSDPEFSLTERGVLRYNTNLVQDNTLRIYW